MLAPADVSATGSKNAKALHAATALPQIYAMLQEQSAGHSSAFTGRLAGCERDIQRLSSVALTYLTQVCPSPASLPLCHLEHRYCYHALHTLIMCEYEVVSLRLGPASVLRDFTCWTPLPSSRKGSKRIGGSPTEELECITSS